ncbi:early light-induced protein, chloroplastic-like [Gastrolobium bilobum]|uniref:early light-induced protein, chloroplastic-like n=1 Tax=Gastrolobium bilobum TaxID=150636 RepID=UPI002AB162CC|nr:early light-induced protein, chloroplastic-like [Gastrolobium bilobum]
MATSSYAMQSILGSPMTRFSSRSRVNQFSIPATYMPNLRRNASLRVRSMAEEEQKEQPSEPATPVTPPPAAAQSQPRPASTRAPKVSTKFSDVLAFSGPAPERINGRLAMIGFVAAIAVEIANGQGVLEQVSNGGIPWFLGTSVVLTLASLIPLFQGISVESKSKGFMSSDAELWNGRFAMLGLIALAFTEYVKGSTLV